MKPFRAFPLFPVLRTSDGTPKCGCTKLGCKDIGKHPRVAWRHWEGVEVDDIGTTAKTLPEFPELWERMLRGPAAARVEPVNWLAL